MQLSLARLLVGRASIAATTSPATAAASPRTDERERGFLIRRGHLVTMENEFEIPDADVLVRDGIVADIGRGIQAPGAEIIDASDMVVMPGFVDTHWHLWNSVLSNMVVAGAEYFAIKSAFSPIVTPEDSRRSVQLSVVQAINAGITTVHNFAHNVRSPEHANAELDAMSQSGIRGRFSYGWRDQSPRSETMDLQDVARVKREWFDRGAATRGRLHLGMALRGFLSADDDVVATEFRFARESGLPTVLHTGATRQRGQSVARLCKQGHVDATTILVHWIAQRTEDFDAVLRSGASVSLSPTSDLRTPHDDSLHSALLSFAKTSANVCLSLDSNLLARPSMFEQMSVAWALGVPWAGTETESLPPLDGKTLLRMATINGARALGLGTTTGSLRVGKRADLILVRMRDLDVGPVGFRIEALARTATVANIDTVLIDGGIRKRAGVLVGIDERRVMADAEACLTELRRRAGGPWAPR